MSIILHKLSRPVKQIALDRRFKWFIMISKYRPVGIIEAEMREERRTREKIIESAVDCFSKKGYDATSVEDICRVAGISKGGFFHYFPTKQSLFLEILNVWLEDLNKKMEDIYKSTLDIDAKLLELSTILIDIITTGKTEISLTFEFWNRALRDREILEKIVAMFESYRTYFSLLVEEEIKRGNIGSCNPEAVSYTIVSFAIGLLIQRLFSLEEKRWGEITKNGLELIIKGLKSNGG